MEEIPEKFLPIGTVVMLKGGTKRVMIAGFCPVVNGEKSIMCDYSGCMFPQGFLDSKKILLFNHSQIEKIYHLGLSNDEEEKKFKKRLKEFINNSQNKRK